MGWQHAIEILVLFFLEAHFFNLNFFNKYYYLSGLSLFNISLTSSAVS